MSIDHNLGYGERDRHDVWWRDQMEHPLTNQQHYVGLMLIVVAVVNVMGVELQRLVVELGEVMMIVDVMRSGVMMRLMLMMLLMKIDNGPPHLVVLICVVGLVVVGDGFGLRCGMGCSYQYQQRKQGLMMRMRMRMTCSHLMMIVVVD